MTRRSQFLSGLLRWRLRSEVSHLVRLEISALEQRLTQIESRLAAATLALEDEITQVKKML